MRLDKYLADMNLGTRSEIKKAIRKGAALVDDTVIRDPGYSLRGTEAVVFCGRPVSYEQYSYYMMNKPAGVICASEDRHQDTVIDLMDADRRRDLFPVGRLDKDTVGLVLISNDGELAHRLLSPKFHVDKVYEAMIDGRVNQEDISRFAKGIPYDTDLVAAPALLEELDKEVPKEFSEGESCLSWARVTIHEGKFHQVKKMFQAIGKQVHFLKRVSMGPLHLDDTLGEGEYRALTEDELQELREAAR